MRRVAKMSSRRRRWTSSGVAAIVLLGVGLRAAPERLGQTSGPLQQQQPQQPGFPSVPSPLGHGNEDDGNKERMDADRARMMRNDRHKRLAEDTDRLVQLSNELKAEVDKAGKDDLSLTVIRKATEIEKLAHDVREREKN